jgi:hypothetical protein
LIGKTEQSTSWLPRGWSGAGLNHTDAVILEVYLCEAIPGDAYIDRDLWKHVDDQVVPLEHKALLEENGIRVGQIGSAAPAHLQDLLASKKTCPDPRQIRQQTGKPTRIRLGPPMARSNYRIRTDEVSEAKQLDQTEFAFVIVPTPAAEGRTRLRFMPEVAHGQAATLPAPTLDRTAWMFQKQQATESYPALAWDMTLSPNEFAVVGGQFDRPNTWGQVGFIRPDESPPRQRLLVIRAARPSPSVVPDSMLSAGSGSLRRSPPLALQAAWTTFRGVSP